MRSLRTYAKRLIGFPAIHALAALSGGILTAKTFSFAGNSVAHGAVLCGLILVLIALVRRSRVFLGAATVILFFTTGVYLCAGDLTAGNQFEPTLDKRLVRATVRKILASGPEHRILLVSGGVDVAAHRALPGNGRLFLRNCSGEFGYGDRIAFWSRLRKPRNRGNPGEFDWENFCRNQGIYWLASERGKDSVLVIRRGSGFHPAAWVFAMRASMNDFLVRHSSGDTRAVLKSMVLGDRGELTPTLKTEFVSSGLIHMLSASGLHVGIIVLLALVLTRLAAWVYPQMLLSMPLNKWCACTAVFAMVCYCLLAGARLPTMRATLMGAVFALAILNDKQRSSLQRFSSLALAALILLLLYPLSLFSTGFHLSFWAVAAILFLVPLMRDKLWERDAQLRGTVSSSSGERRKSYLTWCLGTTAKWFAALFLASFAAQTVLAPILLYSFHSAPVYSLPANLVAGPVVSIGLPIAMLATIIGAFVAPIGAIVLAPAAYLMDAVVSISRFFSELPFPLIRIPEMGFAQFLLLFGLAWLVLWFLRTPSVAKGVAIGCTSVLVILAASLATKADHERLQVTFLNVGRADAIYVKIPGAGGLMVDTGLKTQYFDAGQSIVAPFLEYQGLRSLAGIIISHPDMDHIGGLLSLMRRVPAGAIWWNSVSHLSEGTREIVAAIRSQRIPLYQVDRTAGPLSIGRAVIEFLNFRADRSPVEWASRNLNNLSVVARLKYGDVSFLFTGDLEAEGERRLLSSETPLRADVLKVAHHGSGTSTSAEFLQAVQPRIAVISSGYPAYRKVPDPLVLERLQAVGARVFWTGRDGAVQIDTDGKSLWTTSGATERMWKCTNALIDRDD